jgi:hypothetical protein
MAICRLCNKAEATKTNSHILPHFLIKTAINKEGSKQRDYELTFSISENEFVDTFFGRSITLETIEQYKGRELNEEEIKKQNPFAMDYLFCPSCENKISKLEEYYSKNVHQRLLKNNADKVFKDSVGNQILVFDKVSLEMVLLFIYSIFFRCSISRYHGFRLKNWERKLRKTLNKYLDDSIEKIEQRIQSGIGDFLYLPVINTHFQMPEGDDPTKNFVTILHSTLPYFVYLNDVTFQMFTREKDVGKSKEFFYGITDMIIQKESVNKKGKPFQVVSLTEDQLKKVLTVTFESMATRQMNFIKNAFQEVHKLIFRTNPSAELLSYFVQTLVTQEIAQGERYGREAMAQAMFKCCKIYYQIP